MWAFGGQTKVYLADFESYVITNTRQRCGGFPVLRIAVGFIVLSLLSGRLSAQQADAPDPLLRAPHVEVVATGDPAQRPAALGTLYVSFVGLQVADGFLTWNLLHSGASELNPVVSPVLGNPFALTGFKVVGTAATIFLVERLRHKHPRAAVWTMVAINVGMGLAVLHNASSAAVSTSNTSPR